MNNLQAAQMEALVDSLLDSYREYSVISNIDSDNRLNREMIIKICDMVRQILFPGYFEYKKLKSETVRYHVGELLENIEYELTKQVAKALECAGEKAEGKLSLIHI